MISSPKKFQTALKPTPFSKANIKDIRPNFKRGIIVIELDSLEDTTLQSLLEVKKLGEYPIKCTQPVSDCFSFGVISPIETDEELDIEDINVNGDIPIVKVERMMRTIQGGKKIPSKCIKITFGSPVMPTTLQIHYFNFKIRPYTPPPIQCFRCQILGHTTGGCKASLSRCLYCAGPHKISECTATTPKCSNCAGEHKANSSICKYLQVVWGR